MSPSTASPRKVSDRYSADKIAEYYSSGEWLPESFYASAVAQATAKPDKVYVFDSTTSLTFAQFRETALRLAVGLKRLGVGKGDRVAAQLPNWTEFPVIAAATSRIGAIIVPIMPIYRAHDVGYVLQNSGAIVGFTADEFRGFGHVQMFHDLRQQAPMLSHIIAVRPVDGVSPATATAYADLLAAGDLADLEIEAGPDSSPDDGFQIVYTSGTTSRPKGCYHTLNTVRSSAVQIARSLKYTEDDVQFGPSPITHSTGLVTSVLLPMLTGASSHFMEVWEPKEGLQRIKQHGITAAVTATAFLQMLMAAYDPEKHDAGSLRLWVCAGSPIPGSVVSRAGELFAGCKTLSLYGRSENLLTTMCSIDDPAEKAVRSDGAAVAPSAVHVVDEMGNEVQRGEEGDVAYFGPSHMIEYWGNEAETAALFTPDGYSRSGDLGRMDAEGYVRVTGRLKDIIIRGGMNISAREIEDNLLEHPSVADAAVVAMPDQRLGEKVCAYVVPKAGADALTLEAVTDFLRTRGIAVQKLPERLELVEMLPTTATGKIQKNVLRSELAAKLG